jgi:hypothetical protein
VDPADDLDVLSRDKYLSYTGIRTPNRPVRSLITTMILPSRLFMLLTGESLVCERANQTKYIECGNIQKQREVF